MLQCNMCKQVLDGDPGAKCTLCGGTETIPLPEPPPTSVTVRFAGPGSAVFGLDVEGQITPGQLAAAGQYLSLQAWLNWAMPHVLEAVADAVVRRLESDESQIAVPGMTSAGVSQILKGMRND